MVQKRLAKATIDETVKLLTTDILINAIAARCNPILPLRDVKFTKVKTVRRPKLDMAKLLESHADEKNPIPDSIEGQERIAVVVEVAEETPAADADAAKAE